MICYVLDLKISGMKLANIRPHKKYGIAIFIRSTIQVASAHFTEANDTEILTIEIDKFTVTSIYNPQMPCSLQKTI